MTILHRIKPFLAAVSLVCMAQAPVTHAALLSLQPDTSFASNGDTVSFELIVSGLGNFAPDSLGAFDLSVSYDNAVLSFADYTLGNFLGDLAGFTALDVSSGDIGAAVNLAEISLLLPASLNALQPDSFLLASLSFDVLALAPGATTSLSILDGAVLSDATGSALQASTGQPATIGAIPLPGTLLLILSGMLGWSASRKTRNLSTLPRK
ncbi:Uncharacterised protein [Halioglobus japonicus]|nr:Uncharacterised protein [Halioglobus japonicus]